VTARRLGLGSAVLGASTLAWAVVIVQTGGMAMGFWPYVGAWVAMTMAMMLPSATPMLLLVDRLSPGATPLFLLGYVASWTLFGIAAYSVGSALSWPATGWLLLAAGLYHVLPFKRSCLRHCRNPLAFLRAHAGDGPFRTGVAHGAFCIGCCAGLMVVLIALGMASILWMALVAAAILAERLLPGGEQLATLVAFGLIGTGVWLVLA
jgi:predicted metal-binding membrane protein